MSQTFMTTWISIFPPVLALALSAIAAGLCFTKAEKMGRSDDTKRLLWNILGTCFVAICASIVFTAFYLGSA